MNIRKTKGFSLIEVVVALLILSVAFTSIILSVQNNLKQLQYLNDRTAALWVASNIISEAQIGIIRLDKTIKFQQGKRIMFNSNWYWRAQIIPVGENVYKIAASVRKEKKTKPVVKMQGFLLP